MKPLDTPLASLLWAAVRFLCRHVLYLGIVLPLILVAAFYLGPRIIALCGAWFDPLTLVQPIEVSDDFRRQGYTDQTLQHLLVDTLSDLRKEAESVTPANDTEHVLSEFKLPDFTVPGTGLSIRPMIEFARTLLKRDSSVYGTVVGSPSSFAVMLTLRDPDGRTVALGNDVPPDTGGKPNVTNESQAMRVALRQAAMTILQHQSPLLHASYLTQMEQKRCLKGDAPCQFDDVRERFAQIAAGSGRDASGASKEDAAWAMLALSKLDTYARDYEGSIRHARAIVERSEELYSWQPARPWAYYNWGVALTDMGCYQQAADVLRRAVELHKDYAPAHNALARAWLALAQKPTLAGGGPQSHDYRAAAVRELRIAIEKSPGYQEAYVNLGDALRLPSMKTGLVSATSLDEARDAYRTAVALDIDNAGRAYERLVTLSDRAFVKVASRITRSRTQCATGMARSLLESWGCSDAQIEAGADQDSADVQPVALRAATSSQICSKPELALPATTPAGGVNKASRIIEVKNVDDMSKPRDVAPGHADPIRKAIAQQQRG
ncbi:tetratricopeptide repeat protein [Burkholderia sp. Ac-20365]|jgi:tetratricopeptide (TPR) repeat protein|uniref:tetratricopeptide repeat protein n=1 Tax=Burkholderia sp. Ac-20365 TaxID=2703897 RepID=UPI00197B23A9|nr:tetratricopeptide repeat protein [Burkholderia sp. Ac-20365]MBN3764432.1 tetratricopeptide repeat protein [Burkholderia sp. Ac-20365]